MGTMKYTLAVIFIFCTISCLSKKENSTVIGDLDVGVVAKDIDCPDANKKEAISEDEMIELIGVPTFFGNEPKTYLCLVVKDSSTRRSLSYFIPPEYQRELKLFVGQLLVVKGRFDKEHPAFFNARQHDNTIIPESWKQKK